MDERRNSHRARVIYGAAVDFNGRQSIFDCVIRNYSSNGALIEFANGTAVPDTLNLTIRHRGETVTAKTVWQSHNRAGLAFMRESQSPNVIDLATRRRAMRRRLEGFLSDETAGIGLDSLLVITAGGLVATGVGHVAGHAIEQKFQFITETLKHLH